MSNYLDFPAEVPDRHVGRRYWIETSSDGTVAMELTKLEGGIATFEVIDGEGWLELDWMEFIDQASIGRIRRIQS